MKPIVTRLLILFLALFFAGAVHAQNELYVVMHIDTAPPPSATGPTAAQLLRQWAAETSKEAGCVRFEVLQQADRGNHFAVVGVWKDRAAFDEHEAAAYTRKFRELIQPMLGSPFDERLHHLLQ